MSNKKAGGILHRVQDKKLQLVRPERRSYAIWFLILGIIAGIASRFIFQ